jgi:hypothetical protein
MPIDAKAKTLRLAEELLPPDALSAQGVAARAHGGPARLVRLAERLAGAQRTMMPTALDRGLILFAADAAEAQEGSEQVKAFFCRPHVLRECAQEQRVNIAVTDIGLEQDINLGGLAGTLFRQRQPLKAPTRAERFWESLQAGVRMACLLRGQGTDVFGTGSLRDFAAPARDAGEIIAREQWEIAAMAGVILGAASVQALSVIAGRSGEAAAALAGTLSPVTKDYVVSAKEANDFLQCSSKSDRDSLPGVILTLGLCSQAARGAALV